MKLHRRLGVYLPLFAILSVFCVTLRTVALFYDYNIVDKFFDNKLLISTSNITVFVGALVLLTFTFVSKKIRAVADFNNPATYIPSGIVSVALIFFFVECISTLSSKNGGLFSKDVLTTPSNLLLLIAGIMALFCVFNFFFTVFYVQKKNEPRAGFGLLTAVFLAIYALYLYFDFKLPINSPNKLVDQMAFLFSACFFLFETRISLGREKWRGYVSFGMIAAFISAYSSIPTIIYYIGKGQLISDSFAETMVVFTLFVYITARVILVDFLLEDEKNSCVLAIEELSKMRSEELALPSQERIDNKEGSFNTLGANYEINLHLTKKAEIAEDTEKEE